LKSVGPGSPEIKVGGPGPCSPRFRHLWSSATWKR